MKLPFRFAPYSIDGYFLPNAKTNSSKVSGLVVEVNGGYGCMQAWPELGDYPLEFHLESLRDGRPTEMGRACLNCCQIDGDARRAGINLFSGLVVPRSHFLIAGVNGGVDFDSQLALAKANGIAKIKGSPDLAGTLGIVERVSEHCSVRLDFNSSLDAKSFESFISALSIKAKSQIEFIEDPTPYNGAEWSRLSENAGVMLALDWGPSQATKGFGVRIWKPSRQLCPPGGETHCITHNMDHLLGRRYAAYQAAGFKGSMLDCGLDHSLPLDGETGLGLDGELSSMEWQECS